MTAMASLRVALNGYVCRAYVPSTPQWRKLYEAVTKALHALDYRKRTDPHLLLEVGKDESISAADGFLLADHRQTATVSAAIERARDLAASEDFDELAARAKKPFLIIKSLDLEDPENCALVDLACSRSLLGPVTGYLGGIPVLGDAAIWYSPNKEAHGRSQLFHLDTEDVRQVKVFIPLETVTELSGPFSFVSAEKSRQVLEKRMHSRDFNGMQQRVSDDEILGGTPTDLIQFVGEPGQVIFVDTANCYHYGSRKSERPRLLLHFHYYSLCSMDLPLWRRRYRWSRVWGTKSKNANRVRKLVLGLKHLAFPNWRRQRRSVSIQEDA